MEKVNGVITETPFNDNMEILFHDVSISHDWITVTFLRNSRAPKAAVEVTHVSPDVSLSHFCWK